MEITAIANTIIRGERALAFPLKYDDMGQTIWDANGGMVMQIRGWGRLQYHSEGQEAAARLQDEIGRWVVKTLNEAWWGANKINI